MLSLLELQYSSGIDPLVLPQLFARNAQRNISIQFSRRTLHHRSCQNAADTAYLYNATNLPASCGIIVNVTSSATSAYTFGLILPDEWNNRSIAVGNGGFSGGINWPSMGSLISYRFATMSTNTGHNSTLQNMNWAFNNDESKKDCGYRALHGSTVIAKQVIADYYEGRSRTPTTPMKSFTGRGLPRHKTTVPVSVP